MKVEQPGRVRRRQVMAEEQDARMDRGRIRRQLERLAIGVERFRDRPPVREYVARAEPGIDRARVPLRPFAVPVERVVEAPSRPALRLAAQVVRRALAPAACAAPADQLQKRRP
jgi:hypothetical protein